MASGLESIALAVAHLERVQSGEGQETDLPPEQPRQYSRSPPSAQQEKEKNQTVSPPSYHQYASMPRSVPFSQQTPRLVSMDTVSTAERSPPRHHYAENLLPQHSVSQHHYEGMMASPQFRRYEPQMHSPRVHHDEFIYQAVARQQGQPSYMMMQNPLSHRRQQHQELPPPPLRHNIHSPASRHQQQPRLMSESPSADLTQSTQVLPPTPQQTHTQAAQPSSAGQLPAALLTITDSLEGFFTMDMDPSAYPPVPKPSEVIIQVQRNDVLLGRGGETNHHIGNIQYRQLVKLCQPAYLEAKRRDKPKIAERIVYAVRCLSGRFLKKDSETSTWRDVGNTRAREKTSQALREGAPELRNGVPTSPVKRGHSDISVPPPMESHQHHANMMNTVTMTAENYHAIMQERMMRERANMMARNLPRGAIAPPSSEAELSAAVGGFGGLVPKPAVTVESSPQPTPKKKRRIAEEMESKATVKNDLPAYQPQDPPSPTTSVPTTVSGDDEEIALTSSKTPNQSGQDITNSPKTTRALPRIKLLKKRLEQGA